MSTTFSAKNKIATFTRKIELAIPPEDPKIHGHIHVDYKVRSKPEVSALAERGLDDTEYLPEIVSAIHGLGDPQTDEELTGDAAINEALTGHYSMYLVPAIVTAYFEQYNEARRGNSKRRR